MRATVDWDCGSYVVLVLMPESRANLDDVTWRALLSFGKNETLAKRCAKALSAQRWNDAQLFELHKNYNVKHEVTDFEWECYNTGLATFSKIVYKKENKQ